MAVPELVPSVLNPVIDAWRQPSAGSDSGSRDIEALFYSFDANNDGVVDKRELVAGLERIGRAIDQSQLSSALDRFGFTPSQERIDALFAQYDTDGSGALSLDEFTVLATSTGLDAAAKAGATQSSLRFAMDLFQRYDEDGSGSLDKAEFKGVALEIEADRRRRNLIACATAAASAMLVSRYSDEYQWAQKTFRSVYAQPQAEAAQRAAFPTARLSADVDAAVARTLAGRGYTPQNTLFGHSVCSDELNFKPEQLIDLMVSRWQEGFSLGGLGGLPFAGKSGFRAYLHHTPDSGKLLVLFAPHVGIDAEGRIGAMERDGQSAVSKACGAGIGAYKALAAKARGAASASPSSVLEIVDKDSDKFDPELETIISLLGPRITGISQSSDQIAFVTYQMYALIKELVEYCITNTPDVWEYASEVAVVGGVMINRRVGGDFFQPLSFEARRPNGQATVDLYEQTFGKPPDLVPVLGSEAAVRSLYEKKPKATVEEEAGRAAKAAKENERAMKEELMQAVKRAQAAAESAEQAAAAAAALAK